MENILITKERMCKSYFNCNGCPLKKLRATYDFCADCVVANPDEAIAIVTKWGKANKVKTIKDDFLEKFTNAPIRDSGIPKACSYHLGYIDTCPSSMGCIECWNRPLSEVEKENKTE